MENQTDKRAQSANHPAICYFCERGQHQRCTARPDVTLTSKALTCQCACQDERRPVSVLGLSEPVVSAKGRTVGVRKGDGRVFMFGPGVVGV